MTIHRSIFYLDDDPAQLDIFREMFGSDYDIRTSTSLDNALQSLIKCAADIIISDHQMPGVRGTDFLRAAAQACPDSVRVLLTGQVSLGEVLPEMASGVVHLFISKPWREAEMREALERAASLGGAPRGEQ